MPQPLVLHCDGETTKYRVTFDCSSKEDGMASLNDCLETGKCLFIDLLMNLVRFRCYEVGMSADIEKAFLMVGLKEEDRDLFRFLISKNSDNLDDTEPRRMRFT